MEPSNYPSGAPSEAPSPSPTEWETDAHRALAALYQSAGGKEWARRGNWMYGDPCEVSSFFYYLFS